MSTRLQVLLEETEMEEIRRQARRHNLTVAEWVRQALRERRRQESAKDSPEKLRIVRKAVEHSFPTGDIGQINEEIERGYHE